MIDKNNIKITGNTAHEAAEWFIKLRDDDISDEEYLDWQCWLEASEANRRSFALAESSWNALDSLPVSSRKTGAREQGAFRRILPYAASIAAVLFIALTIGFFYQDDISPAVPTTTYQTARAEHKNLRLADGSLINLGARSIVNVKYDTARRHITLVRGEAVFTVAKNKNRPFVVQTGKGTVTAIGTKFNIRANSQNVTVTVLEGIVEVNPLPDAPGTDRSSLPRVGAGKRISYNNEGNISQSMTTNIEAAISWEQGLLVRVDTPLSSVIEDVNRYSEREIIIGDSSLSDIKFTGTVLSDGIDNWLRGLSVAYPIKVLDTGRGAILLLAKSK